MSYEIAAEDFRIPSDTAGIELFVRNKRPKDPAHRSPEKTLLYVHGTSQAAEATFDLALEGYSWMDYLAARGWDVFLVDLRGYGGSSRPPRCANPRTPIRRSSRPTWRSGISAPPSISSAAAAASRGSPSWAGRGARRSSPPMRRGTRTR